MANEKINKDILAQAMPMAELIANGFDPAHSTIKELDSFMRGLGIIVREPYYPQGVSCICYKDSEKMPKAEFLASFEAFQKLVKNLKELA